MQWEHASRPLAIAATSLSITRFAMQYGKCFDELKYLLIFRLSFTSSKCLPELLNSTAKLEPREHQHESIKHDGARTSQRLKALTSEYCSAFTFTSFIYSYIVVHIIDFNHATDDYEHNELNATIAITQSLITISFSS